MEVFARSLGIKLYLTLLFAIVQVQFSIAVTTTNVSAEETTENTSEANNNNYVISTSDEGITTRTSRSSEVEYPTTAKTTVFYLVNANLNYGANEGTDTTTTITPTTATITSTTTTSTTEIPTTTKAPCSEPVYITNIRIREVLKTSIQISINLTEEDKQCNNYTILVNCIASNDWDWVVKNLTNTLYMDSTYGDFEVGRLSPFTDYTCNFTVEGGNWKNITFRTLEDVPSQPTNLTLTKLGSTTFQFNWNESAKIPTYLFGYNVTITRENTLDANHYWTHCANESEGFYSNFINVTENGNYSYYFDKALANFNYTVVVRAWSSAGSGDVANLTVPTLVSESEPPQNVTYEIVEKDTVNNIEMALNISWNMPCNTNGPVKYFVIEINGTYVYDESIVQESMFNTTIMKNSTFSYYTIRDLMAASNYSLKIYATNDTTDGDLHGIAFNFTFETNENYPSAPQEITYSSLAHNFTVAWNEPTNNPGNITEYEIEVRYNKMNWIKTDSCIIDENMEDDVRTYNSSESEFTVTEIVPYTTYDVMISAYTSRGKGNSTSQAITSSMDFPEINNASYMLQQNIDSDEYDVNATINIVPGCFYGDFTSYNIDFQGTRDGHSDHLGNYSLSDYNNTTLTFAVRPEHLYSVNVMIKNSQFNTFKNLKFNSTAGVPTFDSSSFSNIEAVTSSTEATLTLNREYFDDSQGTLRYIAIIVSDKNITGGDFCEWDSSEWPKLSEDTDVYYQATSKYWNPFTDSISVISYTLGQNESCSDDELYCNRPLEPDQTYYVFIRVFNNDYYRNSMPITVITDPLSKLGFILGIIFGLLSVSAIGFVAFILWRRGVINITNKGIFRRHNERSQFETSAYECDRELLMNFLAKDESDSKTEITKEKFIEYCNYLEHNPEEVKTQWQDLQTKSEEEYGGLKNNIALFPENRRKNRFTNILPFDHTRVKLNMEEDDEISSDYINASYIKGFSNQNEYIATQGPLPDTVRDFWKMIFQENISVIVMVAGFIENKREKCYKYFPNNHESVLFGDDIEVRCSTELNFQIYCVRTLQVRKDIKQLTVTHMQFLEWPDFGVPQGTDNLMHFCQIFRERWASEGGMAVVHCSAGVGRTGTIIATDILIRAIEAGKKIDVFNTVLEMRKQRKCMVQTEKQYLYIHQLIKNYLETPFINEDDSSEHLYQNIGLSADVKTGLAESAL